MQLLSDLLPSKVASPLSINAVRENLEVSHRAVTSWLSILEVFYYYEFTRSIQEKYAPLKKHQRFI